MRPASRTTDAAPRPQASPPAPAPGTTPKPQRPVTPPPAAKPAGRPLSETASLTLASRDSDVQYTQRGTATGTFTGDMELVATITSRGVVVTFTVNVTGAQSGTVSGRGVVIPHLDGGKTTTLVGTVRLTGGTGAFAGIRGTNLQVGGTGAVDGSKATVHLTGTVFV